MSPRSSSTVPPTAINSPSRWYGILPPHFARLVYAMEEIDAQTALQLGIVSRVVAAAELITESDRLVVELCGKARDALIGVKDYFRAASGLQGRAAADLAGNMLATVISSLPR